MNRIVAIIAVLIVGVGCAYYFKRPKEEKLPVINPIDVEEEMVDPELLRIGYGHKVGSFSFLNQNGETITEKEVKGRVHVAEYFFTTCGTICPKMNQQMKRVHEKYKSNDDVRILSFTVNPEVDSVEQMKRYADGHKANSKQWHFLTGDKEKLYELARKSYFVLKPAEAQNLGDAGSDFIHTNNFVLVDQKSRIRGYYDGTSPKEVNQLMVDIQRLLENE